MENKADEKALAYCVRCKKKQEYKTGTETCKEGKRKQIFLMGLCSVCGTKMCRILPKALLEDKPSSNVSYSTEDKAHGKR